MLRIKKVAIENYRKLNDIELFIDEKMTVIAGSNNFGKTSLVELFGLIFKDNHKTISVDDMSFSAKLENEDKIKQTANSNSEKDEKVKNLLDSCKHLKNITIDIDVEYDDSDDISLFSSYLMDLDEDKKNFYFRYEFQYKKIKEKQLSDNIEDESKLIELFSELEPVIYYCDKKRDVKVTIDNKSSFQSLFNYESVEAIRKLSDTYEDKSNNLSNHLLNTVKNSDQWNSKKDELITRINEFLKEKDLSKEINEVTVQSIVKTLDDFSKTNGGNSGKLGVNFELYRLDIEKVLQNFIKIYYEEDGHSKINEEKQGLGWECQ